MSRKNGCPLTSSASRFAPSLFDGYMCFLAFEYTSLHRSPVNRLLALSEK